MKRRNRIQLALRRGVIQAAVVGPLTFLLVAGAGCPSLFESTTHRAAKIKQAEPGSDGDVTLPAGQNKPNRYAKLDANASVGATTITVKDVNANFLSTVAAGDLLLIIQMQGATISNTTCGGNTASCSAGIGYGAIDSETDYGTAGHYELVGVQSVSGTEITLSCALKSSYSVAGRTQVVWVPQYNSLTIGSATSIEAEREWNCTASPTVDCTGGVVAVHVATELKLGNAAGSISATGVGFRGGAVDNQSSTVQVTACASTSNQQGAEKGEGIAGYQGDYPGGGFNCGPGVNGGGGGNSHNAGGGGGANAASGAAWTGRGLMEQCDAGEAYRDAWLLESAGTCSKSQGGGRGGYTYAEPNTQLSPLTTEPGNTSWGGNYRRDFGGLGGRPVPNDPARRLFMGGGGGAGDGNNSRSGRGGRGGGLVFVIADKVTGTGSIVANGEAGASAPGTPEGDGAGGGGGGGTVIVHAGTSIDGTVTISANGGPGGDQGDDESSLEVEGPGGGGGGGYIAISGAGAPQRTASGGRAGRTLVRSMSLFPPNGATAGNAGITNGNASTFLYCAGNLTTTIVTMPSNPSGDTTPDFTFTTTATAPATFECKLDRPSGAGTWESCAASYTPTPALTVDGTYTLWVRGKDGSGNVDLSPPHYTWVLNSAPPVTTIATGPSQPFSNDSTPEFTFTNTKTGVTYQCKLDGPTAADLGTYAPCNTTGAATYAPSAPLADGTYTLSVYSVDAGNVQETPAKTHTWTIDTVAPDTRILSGPPDPSASPFGTFTFDSPDTTATFECSLDGAAFTPCQSPHTTVFLGDGLHTLAVRAVDPAGNVDGTPAPAPTRPAYIWEIQAAFLDGGTLDAGETEAGGVDGGVVVVDADDTDGDPRDVPIEMPPPRDIAPDRVTIVVDVGASEAGAEASGARLETGQDTGVVPEAQPDTQPPMGPEVGRDSALVFGPEAGPETTPPVVKEDAASQEDAAVIEPDIKVLGGGFCAISTSRTASPVGLALLGLAALTLLRRRRSR